MLLLLPPSAAFFGQRVLQPLVSGKFSPLAAQYKRWSILPKAINKATVFLSLVRLMRMRAACWQETWTDASGSFLLYAPVDIPSNNVVMGGGDPAYVALLPSGF